MFEFGHNYEEEMIAAIQARILSILRSSPGRTHITTELALMIAADVQAMAAQSYTADHEAWSCKKSSSRFFAHTLSDGAYVVVVLEFGHTNTQFPLSPDGYAYYSRRRTLAVSNQDADS